MKQIIFLATLLASLGVFAYTVNRLSGYFRLTRAAFPVRDTGKRIMLTLRVAFGQTKIFRFPLAGVLHAIVFWGFLVILFGSAEMIIDGLSGSERILSALGPVYDILILSGDVFALLIIISLLVFLARRLIFKVKRFKGIEMKPVSKADANLALTLILLLMVSLLGMNSAYIALHPGGYAGIYPVSALIAPLFASWDTAAIHTLHELNWWVHILLIFLFANILPYSKHFHVFMSIPNVYLSRLSPLGYLPNMENVTREVRLMLNPETAYSGAAADAPVERFGVKDAEDVSWKNYLDSLACTECGRCTSVCPANITGKLLSPRKIFIDLRARMKEKGPGMLKNGREYTDNKSLVRDYVTAEELWACTTCNACAMECPVNINHPTLIVDMRRYLVMEEAAAPAALNAIFSNIENNGAPWQFSPEDRLLWAGNLYMNTPAAKS
jgi:heterodisulfide reductase subunit C/nitrate reductase gamma subunit